MDVEIPVLTGYLSVPTQSSFSLNRISKKKSCHRYCLLFNSSRHGIERLEICESKDDKNPKIITLENCVKITQEPSPANLIQIVKKTETLTFNTLTDEDQKEWINALQMVAFRDKNSTHGSHSAIEEDNDLYCSSFGDGLFIITLIPSDTSIRCNIEPKAYMLHLTATELQLKSAEDLNIVIAMWPYRFIRKYGYRDGKFTFEAGRKCSTGEGVFTLDHTNPQEIFRCMSAKMKSMKKLISSESRSVADCNENQLNIAASMEAGSRSPLPPSSQHSIDGDMSSQSCVSLRGFLSSNDSLNNFSVSSNSNNSCTTLSPPLKHIPNKPPRKLQSPLERPSNLQPPTVPASAVYELKSSGQLNCDKLKKYQNYDPVSITTCMDPSKNVGSTVLIKPNSPEMLRKPTTLPNLPARNESTKNTPMLERDYESIETITDAWKTLGVGDVRHTERNANDDDILDFAWQRTLSQREKCTHKDSFLPVKTPKIIDIDIGEGSSGGGGSGSGGHNANDSDDTYDRLDFLSPNHKTSSGYKTIVSVISPSHRIRCNSPTLNDYEMIASPDTQSCRKADDSHLGYGVLRKASTGSATTPPTTKPLQSVSANANTGAAEPVIAVTTRSMDDSGTALDHRSYNGLNYTIVSKPKRV